MTNNSTTSSPLQSEAASAVHLLDDWFDPIEAGLRERVREFIQAMIESELEAALVRPRYGRRPKADAKNGNGPSSVSGHRHGHRSRSLMGTFGRVEIAVPRARLDTAEGKTAEWKSKGLRAYQRRTKQADALIAGAYLGGTNTRRVRRARLHEEFKRRIKTQTVLPSAETAAMLFWALLAAGQITMRKVDGWQTLANKLADKPIDLAA